MVCPVPTHVITHADQASAYIRLHHVLLVSCMHTAIASALLPRVYSCKNQVATPFPKEHQHSLHCLADLIIMVCHKTTVANAAESQVLPERIFKGCACCGAAPCVSDSGALHARCSSSCGTMTSLLLLDVF